MSAGTTRGYGVHKNLALFKEDADAPVLPEENQGKRGRDKELIEKRNRCLFLRFIWYTNFRKYSSGWIYERLCEEFFLSATTIGECIEDNSTVVYDLRREGLTTRDLKKQYSWMDWGNPE